MTARWHSSGATAGRRGPGAGWLLSLVILLATAIVAIGLKPLLDGEVSSGLIFVLGITLIGAYAGLVRALFCAVVASAVFNFFLADPVLTFRMTTGEDLAPPIIFTLCAIVSGLLSGRLRDQSFRVEQSNLRLQSLLAASRHLQEAAREEDVFEAVGSALPAALTTGLALYRLDHARPVPVGGSRHDAAWLRFAARTAAENVEFLRDDGLSGYLLSGSQGVVGVLVNDEPAASGLDRNFMLALARVIGLALERAQLASRVAEVQALARTEELKTALLSSVSHDLRTPLTAISTSASSMLAFGSQFDADTSRRLLGGIVEECDRLNHLTSNLLEMTRLQGGTANLRRSVLPAAEMIRNGLARQRRWAGKRFSFTPPAQEIFVEADTALFELALANVLQNAIVYSPPESIVRVTCEEIAENCVIAITDEGIGIPREEQSRVFERFYRVERKEAGPKGTGLGLAIAKGFVEASHGLIAITSPVRDGRGTTVTIRLPLARLSAVA